MFCSIACFLVFLRVVSRFKGHFIQSSSVLCPFLIVKCTFDKLGCIGCCFAAFLWRRSLFCHTRKLQINPTYLTSGMLFEKKKINRIRTVSILVKADILCTLSFNHFCSEAVAAHIPDATKSWRTISGGCSTALYLGQLSPHLLLCPNLNCSFLLICFCVSSSVMLFWLLLWLLICHKTDHDDRG